MHKMSVYIQQLIIRSELKLKAY